MATVTVPVAPVSTASTPVLERRPAFRTTAWGAGVVGAGAGGATTTASASTVSYTTTTETPPDGVCCAITRP